MSLWLMDGKLYGGSCPGPRAERAEISDDASLLKHWHPTYAPWHAQPTAMTIDREGNIVITEYETSGPAPLHLVEEWCRPTRWQRFKRWWRR